MDNEVSRWLKDPEFLSLPDNVKSEAIGNYFVENYADDEFFKAPVEIQREAANGFITEHFSSVKPVETKRTMLGTAGDVGVSLAKGIVGAGEAAVGLADIPSFGLVGNALEKVFGYDPKTTQDVLASLYSPSQQKANKAVEDAKGFFGKASAAIQNPSTIGMNVVESTPSMLGGAGIARGLLQKGMVAAPVVAGAIGEGLVGAGSSAEQTRQETGTLSPKQALSAVGSGTGTAAFALAGGRIAEKLGFADIDTMLAGGGFKEGAGNIIKRIVGGGISEGVFEELPQSMQEQVWLNAALDRPLMTDVPEAGAEGMLAGAVMGGGANIFSRKAEQPQKVPSPGTRTKPPKVEPRPEPEMGMDEMVNQGVMPEIPKSPEQTVAAPPPPSVTGPVSPADMEPPEEITSPTAPRPVFIPAQPKRKPTDQDLALGGIDQTLEKSALDTAERYEEAERQVAASKGEKSGLTPELTELVRRAEIQYRRATKQGKETGNWGPKNQLQKTLTQAKKGDPEATLELWARFGGGIEEPREVSRAREAIQKKTARQEAERGAMVALGYDTNDINRMSPEERTRVSALRIQKPAEEDPFRAVEDRWEGPKVPAEEVEKAMRPVIPPKAEPSIQAEGVGQSAQGKTESGKVETGGKPAKPALPPPQETKKAPTTPEEVVAAYFSAHEGPDAGSADMAAIRNYAKHQIGPLAKRLEKTPWLTHDGYATTDRKTGRTHNRSKDLKALVDLGYAQMAWDREGNAHYAKAGVNLPEWLTQSENDADLEKLPSKGEVKPVQKTEATGKKAISRGSTSKTYLPDDTEIETEYAVVGVDDLTTSHNDQFQKNAGYPEELQPRGRERKALQQQVERMANTLQPERLGEAPSASLGTSIAGEDLIVESGNGRTIAIRKAYDGRESGKKYRQWLVENAERFGLSRGAVEKIERPVLVRIRKTDMDRVKFAQKTATPDIAGMSPVELARMDAGNLSEDDMMVFAPSEEGNLNAQSNRRFISRFLENVGLNEASGYLTDEGNYNKKIIDRIQSAIFFKAYRDEAFVSWQSEEADPEMRNLLNALTVAAGEFARARALDPKMGGLDVTPYILDAVRIVRQSRREGRSVREILDQTLMFETRPEQVKDIARVLDENIRSGKQMGVFMKEMGRAIRGALTGEKQASLFGVDEYPTVRGIIERSAEKVRRKDDRERQADLFSENSEGGLRQGERGIPGRTENEGKRVSSDREERGEKEGVTNGTELREPQGEFASFKTGQQTFDFVFTPAEKRRAKEILPESDKPRVLHQAQRVRMATTGNIWWDGNVVRNAEDAASLIAPIRKSAQENIYTIVTDPNGTVVEIHRYGKGAKASGQFDELEVMGRVFNVDNASKVYFIHNHPGGNPTSSPEDRNAIRRLQEFAALRDIDVEGLIVGGSRWAPFVSSGNTAEPKAIRPSIRKSSLPIKERMLIKIRNFGKAKQVLNPEQAASVINEKYGNADGFLFISPTGYDLGFMVWPAGRQFRVAADWLIKTGESLNANRIIVNTKKALSDSGNGRRDFLEAFAKSYKNAIPFADIIDQGKSLMVMDRREYLEIAGGSFSNGVSDLKGNRTLYALAPNSPRGVKEGMSGKTGKGDRTTGETPKPEGGNPFKESIVRKPVFHGGDGPIAQFSKDGPSRGDLGMAYFTDDLKTAEKYAYLGGIPKTEYSESFLNDDGTVNIEAVLESYEEEGIKRKPFVTKVYLDIRNPVDLDFIRAQDIIDAVGGVDVFFKRSSNFGILDNLKDAAEEYASENGKDIDEVFTEFLDDWLAKDYRTTSGIEDDESLADAPHAHFAFAYGFLDDIIKHNKADGIAYRDAESNSNIYIPIDPKQIKITPNFSSPAGEAGQFSTSPQTFSGITPAEVQTLFQNIGQESGIHFDGTIWVKTRGGWGFTVNLVDHISATEAEFLGAYGRLNSEGRPIAGKYQDGKITISKVGDRWTLDHENFHLLSDFGVITEDELAAIDRQLQKNGIQNPGKEDRAKWVEDNLYNRSLARGFQRVMQKVRDFIDAFVGLFKATARGTLRGMESGKIYSRALPESTADEGMPLFSEKAERNFESSFPEHNLSALKDIAGIWKGRGKNWAPRKEDTTVVERLLSIPSHYFSKIPALGRMFEDGVGRSDDFYGMINQLEQVDGKSLLKGVLEKLKSDSKADYQKVKRYIVTSDREGKGFRVKNKEGKYIAFEDGKTAIGEFDTEQQAWNAARNAEREKLISQGFSDQAADAVVAARHITDNGFDILMASMRDIIRKAEENGTELPSVTIRDGSKTVKIDLKVALAKMNDIRGHYFPRIRKPGRFSIYARKDGVNPIYEKFDTRIGLESRANQLSGMGYKIEKDLSNAMPEDVFEMAGEIIATQAIINRALDQMDSEIKGGASQAQLEKLLPDLESTFAKMLAEGVADIIKARGVRAHMIERNDATGKDVWVGYEEDPVTALGLYVRGIAAGEAKKNLAIKLLRHFTGTDISWQEWKEAQKEEGVEKPEYADYVEMVKDRRVDPVQQKNAFKDGKVYMEDLLRNQEFGDRMIGAVRGLAALKYLAGRVAAPAVNLTSLVTSVLAVMHAKAGISFAKAPMLLARAMKQYLQFKRDPSKLNPETRTLFEEIEKRGWHTAQYNREALSVLQSKMGQGWGKFTDFAMVGFSVSEIINRVATIAGTYQGVKGKLGHDEALKLSKEVSDKAHGVYGKANYPFLARGGNPAAKIAQMFYVFRTFSHTYLATMTELGFKDKDYKGMAYMALAPAVIAGAGATVLTPILVQAAKALGIGGDDPEEEIYKWIEAQMGDESERFARLGIAGLMGLSLKGSLAIGITDIPTNLSELMGAPGSVMQDLYYGGKSIARGDIGKGLEKMAPLAVSNVLKAYRESTEGLTTGSNAPLFYGNEQVRADATEAFIRALSFNPARIATIREKQYKEFEVEERYQKLRNDIYARIKRFYLQPKEDQTKASWAEIMGEVTAYNDRVKTRGLYPGATYITLKSIKANLKRSFRPSKKERSRGE